MLTISQNLFRTNIWQKYYLDIRLCLYKKFLKVCLSETLGRKPWQFMTCKVLLTKCPHSGLHNVIIIAESLACMCGRRRRERRKGKAKEIAFALFAGARVAQLVSARPSVREVPSSIPGDHPCFNFSRFCVA